MRAALRITCTTFEAYLGVSLPHGPVRCWSGRGEIPTRREIKCASPKVPKNRKVTQGFAKNTSLHNAHEHSLFVFRIHRSYSAFTTCCRSADTTPILWCDLKLVRRCGALVSAVPSTRYKFEGPKIPKHKVLSPPYHSALSGTTFGGSVERPTVFPFETNLSNTTRFCLCTGRSEPSCQGNFPRIQMRGWWTMLLALSLRWADPLKTKHPA